VLDVSSAQVSAQKRDANLGHRALDSKLRHHLFLQLLALTNFLWDDLFPLYAARCPIVLLADILLASSLGNIAEVFRNHTPVRSRPGEE
jgi:hypothetical protein